MHATVRTFRAPDAASALQAVKSALGSEAVILETREVGGGLFRKTQIEIVAALSDENLVKSKPSSPSIASPVSPPPVIPFKPPQPHRLSKPTDEPPEPWPAPRFSDENSALAREVLLLKRDLDEARREMRVVCSRARAQHDLDMAPEAAETYGRLVSQGVEESLAEEMVRQVLLDGGKEEDLLSGVSDIIAGRLVPGRAPWLRDSRRVIALVGPTGVGKTTTLAKVAAKALVESQLQVALITVDTYRIGASEQISRYGAIMRLPTHIARDRAELASAIERSSQADLILIDTAGRALSEAVALQAELIRTVPGVQLFLVLSAATGARELAVMAERYRQLSPERLIFSKIDEAAAPGSVLSAAVRINRPVACIADGQRVPEDIHAVSSDELCSLVMGAWKPRKAGRAARRK